MDACAVCCMQGKSRNISSWKTARIPFVTKEKRDVKKRDEKKDNKINDRL